jgi:hypothetical protein
MQQQISVANWSKYHSNGNCSSNFTWTIGTITGSITGATAGSGALLIKLTNQVMQLLERWNI